MEKKVLQVSFELEHDTEVLKQFISQNPLGFSHSILLERLQQGSINGAVYVDSFEAMTTVVFVGYPPDFKNTFIRCLSTNNAELVNLLRSIFEVKNFRSRITLTGETYSTDHVCDVFLKLGISVQKNSDVIALPDGYIVGEIRDKDFECIASSWPYYSSTEDIAWFKHQAQKYGSTAIYKEDKVVSWMFESSIGNFLHLFTVPEHRGKGLAAIVVQEACKKIIAKGQRQFCHIVDGNEKSEKLFVRFGFKKLNVPISFVTINL